MKKCFILMNYFLVLGIVFSYSYIISAEKTKQNEQDQVVPITLPSEIVEHIILQRVKATSPEDLKKQIGDLALISKQYRDLLNDESLIYKIIKLKLEQAAAPYPFTAPNFFEYLPKLLATLSSINENFNSVMKSPRGVELAEKIRILMKIQVTHPTKMKGIINDLSSSSKLANDILKDKKFIDKIIGRKLHQAVTKSALGDRLKALSSINDDFNKEMQSTAVKKVIAQENAKYDFIAAHIAPKIKLVDVINKGINASSTKSVEGETPLMEAIMHNDYNLVKEILEHSGDVSKKSLFQEYTPLHIAASMYNRNKKPENDADLAIIELLLKHGSDINTPRRGDVTPLIDAAQSWFPHPRIIELLLQEGANPLLKDAQDETALIIAQRNWHFVDEYPQEYMSTIIKNSQFSADELNTKFKQIISLLEDAQKRWQEKSTPMEVE